MKELDNRIKEIGIRTHAETVLPTEVRVELAKEIKDIATSFAEWINKEGYIYVGEHDYMYPDANGLVGGGYLFDQFIKQRYGKEN